MRNQIVTNICRGNFCVDLFSKIVFAAVRVTVAAAFLFVVLLFANRQLPAQVVEPIKWNNDIKRACQVAQTENRLVIVHFYSDCAPCNSMNANVFTDPRIAMEMNRNFVPVRADMTTQASLAQHYNVTVVPTDLIIIPADEQVVYRRQGEIAAEKYLQFLQYLRNNYSANLTKRHPTTTPSNNTAAINVTNNTPNTVVPFPTSTTATTSPTSTPSSTTPTPASTQASTPFPSQPERAVVTPPDSRGNFAFIGNSDKQNNSTLPSNSLHPSADIPVNPSTYPSVNPSTHPQPVISASGQIDPAKSTSTNIVAAPTVGGVAANPVVPFAAPVVADKKTTGNSGYTNESVAGGNNNLIRNNANIPNNIPNNTAPATVHDKPVIRTNPPSPHSGGISVTNNPSIVRNPVLGNPADSVNVELSGQLMVEVPLAIEGYCPVVLCQKEEWIPGNPAYYAMYRGQVYRFSSQSAMEEFLKMPLKFAPVAMGEDVVMMIDRNKKMCGSRKYGVWFGGRVYLFASKESLNSFIAKPEHYANIAQNYEAAFKSPLDTVQR
ncbi:MAG: DUF255 domain-containing protein [Planctomycetaceae bacterium]|jgi:YHS domain-containing protein/thioredoxin-related protein|nr:DUF255 domain-containing protein [Planctomycetaceae bacterium]